MARKRTYQIGVHTFSSKEAIKAFFRRLKERHQHYTPITVPEDHAAILALLQGHVDRGQKIGTGVKHFFVAEAPDHPNTTCFWLQRDDGSPPTDFGIPACIDGIGNLNRQSLRESVREDIYAYRDARLAGSSLTFLSDHSRLPFPISQAHVHHADASFEEIVLAFAAKEGIDLESELLTMSADASSIPCWREPSLAARFRGFHSNFKLALVSKSENLGELKKAENSRRKEPSEPTL